MKKILCLLLPALATTLLLTACEVGSASDVTPVVSSGGNLINVSGLYRNQSGTTIVTPPNSGSDVVQLDLRQNGDKLEAIDDNKMVFRGSIGSVAQGNGNYRASFNLEGKTTVGSSVTISGTITVGTTSVMSGTWIEQDRYASIRAESSDPFVQDGNTETLSSD